MNDVLTGLVMIIGTLVLYATSLPISKRYKTPLLQPILVVSFVIIVLLLLFDIPYETYRIGGKWIELLMGPAVVALAIPLYRHFDMLKRLVVPVLVGVTVGAVAGVLSGVLLAKVFGFDREIILAIIPKSVTTPVAVSLVETFEGPVSLAAVLVIIAGVSGVLMSPLLFKLFKLNHPIGRGIGMGSASHAIGTGASMGKDAMEGSFATIAMVLCAVIVSFIAPLFVVLFL
jgi:predicted murein hydrolase (TIGR00659 family)